MLLFELIENEEVVIICTRLQDMKGFIPEARIKLVEPFESHAYEAHRVIKGLNPPWIADFFLQILFNFSSKRFPQNLLSLSKVIRMT